MSASAAGIAAGIFFVGYVILQAPVGHWAEHGSAKKLVGASILSGAG